MRSGLPIGLSILFLTVSVAYGQSDKPRPTSNIASGWARTISFSADSRHVISANQDGTVQIWDASKGRLIRAFRPEILDDHIDLRFVALSHDGTTIVTGDKWGDTQIWSVISGKLKENIAPPQLNNTPSQATFTDDDKFLIVSTLDGLVVLSTATWKIIKTIPGYGHNSGYSADSRTVALMRSDKRAIQLFDTSSWSVIRTIPGQFAQTATIAVSNNRSMISVGSGDDDSLLVKPPQLQRHPIQVLKADGRRISLLGHKGDIINVAFSLDDSKLFSLDALGTLKTWDLASGLAVETTELAVGNVGLTAAKFSSGRDILATGGSDEALRMWAVPSGLLVRRLGVSAEPIMSLQSSPSGGELLAVSGGANDYVARVWNLFTGELSRQAWRIPERPSLGNLIAFSSDWSLSVTGAGDSDYSGTIRDEVDSKQKQKPRYSVKLWKRGEGRAIKVLWTSPVPINAVSITPDGRSVVATAGPEVRFWNIDSEVQQWTIKLVNRPRDELMGPAAHAIAFSPNGQHIVLAGSSVWKVGTANGKTIWSQSTLGWLIQSVAFSPDGKYIAVGDFAHTSAVFDNATGRKLHEYDHNSRINSVAFSPDSKLLLVGGKGFNRLLAPDSGKFVDALDREATGHIRAVSFIPGKAMAAAGFYDGSIRLWNTVDRSYSSTLIASNEGQWLNMTAAGFFVGSDQGRGVFDLASIVNGFDTYSVFQFFDSLYFPELVQDFMQGDPELRYQDAAHRLDLTKILRSGAPPDIELVERQTDFAASTVNITVRLFNNKTGGIGSKLVWRVNGVVQGELNPPELQNIGAGSDPVIVARGIRLDGTVSSLISITAFNGAGLLATDPYEILVGPFGVAAPDRPLPKMYVLGIAVDRYEANSGLKPLKYAGKDVLEVAAALKSAGENGIYGEVVIIPPLIDSDVTRDKIDKVFKEVAHRAGPQDAFVLMLAGHGRSVAGRGYFFYPQTARLGGQRTTLTEGISANDWRDWIAKIQTTKRLLIVDTCESADAVFIERAGAVPARRSAIERLREAVGHSVITAARDIAYEGNAYGHGVLSYSILKALGSSENVEIDLKLLDERVSEDVPKFSAVISGIEQHPFNKIVGNFLLGRGKLALAPASPMECGGDNIFFLRAGTQIRSQPDEFAEITREEEAGFMFSVAEFIGKWVKVCRDGVAIGYVSSNVIQRGK